MDNLFLFLCFGSVIFTPRVPLKVNDRLTDRLVNDVKLYDELWS